MQLNPILVFAGRKRLRGVLSDELLEAVEKAFNNLLAPQIRVIPWTTLVEHNLQDKIHEAETMILNIEGELSLEILQQLSSSF